MLLFSSVELNLWLVRVEFNLWLVLSSLWIYGGKNTSKYIDFGSYMNKYELTQNKQYQATHGLVINETAFSNDAISFSRHRTILL